MVNERYAHVMAQHGISQRVEIGCEKKQFRIDLIGIVRLKSVNDSNVPSYSINSAAGTALGIPRKQGRHW